MKIKLKVKQNNKWVNPQLEDLIEMTLISFIAETFEPCAAALYSEDESKPFMIISNTEEVFKFYDDLTVKMLAKDMMNIMDNRIGIKIGLIFDEKSELIEIKSFSDTPENIPF